MKKNIIIITFIICFLFTVPLLYYKKQKQAPEPCEIFITIEGEAQSVSLEQYLIGVVAAEMPASFHSTALQAQAIAARTYVIRNTNYGQKPIKPTTMHQVFINEKARKQKWLTAFAQYEQKITDAVQATAGQMILYDGEPISAMFHASSNGVTESAKNYSGHDLPYLQSVTSPEESSQTITMTVAELNNKLQTNWTQGDFLALKLERNSSGRVQTVIGKKQFSGRDFREQLQLRSTDFTLMKDGNDIAIITKGYGHGVGMSQYGANELAQSSATTEQIITHYYPQTTIGNVCTKK
ncbi:stage II sporulation protein D [Bacillus ndiopicus]|uniref:stage II sporulation protein D n=1 Tax=Bacillus ndiopicus TaxID=1347368 RepID=UPI0005A68770|nr:stage II sporulation protein D [Bacillus ndiopicus]